ncbi:4Fe-4S dicluster domain-containing protein [Maridesulfovibrio ferrireducens]|uniref:4Fe-4S dicluster domain-containing protein n=1 Tax=Maridesulfovibrio ferrireducens TaxID=246191 RepID=A0A1G9JP77_9BACT|nr:4Fe-4S binding protein [Maridesulfovibrio ferrireducens]SDL39328.1 4Fe-4S dicluster domain-containing protein [Maridesulfovibrio ferrireducens]
MEKSAIVNICRGIKGGECRFALFVEESFADRIEKTVIESGWPEFLKSQFGDNISRHKVFSVNAGACPNGCSRPHISDIGLIRACVPVIDNEGCIGCGECVTNCPDDAMQFIDGKVVITREKCLDCGFCTRTCPVEVISCSRKGWRVVAGGRLGRHPHLGSELPGIYSSAEVLLIIFRSLKLWMENYETGKRFGQIMDKVGYDKLLQD